MREGYPFEESWPIEGFALNDNTGKFVQIRIVYEIEKDWWEVRLCFRPYSSETTTKPPHIEMRGKSGRLLERKDEHRCIARFATKEEASAFTHKLHQSEKKSNFFGDIL